MLKSHISNLLLARVIKMEIFLTYLSTKIIANLQKNV